MAKSRARKLADLIVGAGIDIDGNLTFDGGSTSADLTFADNDKANFGDASDLQIWHSGTHSFIKDAGTGDLYIGASSNLALMNSAFTENYLLATSDGAVNLYYDGNKKFETVSGGVLVSGDVRSTNWFKGASDTNTLYSDTSNGTLIQTPSNTNDAAGTFKIRDSLGVVHFSLNTNTNASSFHGGTISSGDITSSGTVNTASGVEVSTSGNLVKHDYNDLGTYVQQVRSYNDRVLILSTKSNDNNNYISFETQDTERMRIDYNGRVGIHATPKDWYVTEYRALQIGAGATFYGRSQPGDEDKAGISANAYYDTTNTRWQYMASDNASRYDLAGSSHFWYTAPSGTADAAITWTQSMTLTSDSYLGIGETLPEGPLHVKSTGHGSIFEGTTGDVGIILHRSDGSGAVDYGYLQFKNSTGVAGQIVVRGEGSASGKMQFFTRDTGGNVTERMVIKNDGNLGVATAAPQARLEVNLFNQGTISNSAMNTSNVNDVEILRAPYGSSPETTSNAGAKWGLRLVGRNDGTYDNGKSGAIYAVSEDALGYNREVGLAFHTSAFDASHVEHMRISADGNIGFGTSAPAASLHIKKSGDAFIVLENTGAGQTMRIDQNSIRTTTNSAISIFANNQSNQLYISNTANRVGVNTNSTAADGITVGTASNGNCEFDLDNTSGKRWRWASLSNGQLQLIQKTDGYESMRVGATGFVGIGETNPDRWLHVNSGTPNVVAKFESTDPTAAIELTDSASTVELQYTNGTFAVNHGGTGDISFQTTETDSVFISNQVHTASENSFDLTLYNASVANMGPRFRLRGGGQSTSVSRDSAWSDPDNNQFEMGSIWFDSTEGSSLYAAGMVGYAESDFNTGDNPSALAFYTTPDSTSTNVERMRIQSNGNVGIGAYPATEKLHIGSGQSNYIRIHNAASGDVASGLTITRGNDTGFALYDNPADDTTTFNAIGNINFRTDNQSYRLYIKDNGNVLINTSNDTTNVKLKTIGATLGGGVLTYSKLYSQLDTTGQVVAGVSGGSNGGSCIFTFTGSGGAQAPFHIIYFCRNAGGNWYTHKTVVAAGGGGFDVEASTAGTTVTFTFKATSTTQYYSPKVMVQNTGGYFVTSYLA